MNIESAPLNRGFCLDAGLYVRTGSHRAFKKLEGYCGRKLRSFWSLNEKQVTLIRHDEWEKVRGIKGVTRARIKNPENYGECWYLDENDERNTRGTP